MFDPALLDTPADRWVAHNTRAFAVRDDRLGRGYTLVVSRSGATDWFAGSVYERNAVLELVDMVKQALDAALKPDGYVVMFTSGHVESSLRVSRLCVHVIPQFRAPRVWHPAPVPPTCPICRRAVPCGCGGPL